MNVTFTESAANQAKVILAGEGDDKLKDRKSVVQGKSVDLGGRRNIKKKKKRKKKKGEKQDVRGIR